jgi:phospholipid/cholesterol/gamma-HCH transport system substrate-binding protein
VSNIDTFTDRLKSASSQLDQIMANVDSTVKSVHELSDSAKGTIAKVDKVIDAVDPESVKTAVANIEQASRTANAAVSDVAKVATKIGQHADDVDQIVQNAKELTQRLNDASVRVNGVLAKVDKLLGSGDANGLMRQASDTLKSFKQVADTLNAQLGPITAGVAHFSGQGLRNVDSLVQEMRRAVEHIDEAVDSLARNPAQIITGGNSGSVPRYNGRARH